MSSGENALAFLSFREIEEEISIKKHRFIQLIVIQWYRSYGIVRLYMDAI